MTASKRRPSAGSTAGAAACAAALLVMAPSALAGQEWRLDAQGGRLRLEASPTAEATATALGGLRWLHGDSWAGLYGGLPVEEDDAAWALATGNVRLLTGGGPVRFGVDLGGELFVQGGTEVTVLLDRLPGQRPVQEVIPLDGGWSGVAEAMPVVAWRGGAWSAELRAGGAAYRSVFGDAAVDRTVGRVHGEVGFAPAARVSLTAEGSWYRADEDAYPHVGLTAATVAGPLLAWASVGAWLSDSVDAVPWAVGARWDVLERVALTASARHSAFDPLYLTGESTSWSVGLSFLLRGPAAPAAPVPARYENGVAVVALDAAAARGVPRVAGDFNGWEPAPMRREDGRWVLDVRVEPGVYYYAFVTEDGTWYVPESTPGRQDDGFGGHVAVLVVQ